MVEYTVDPKVTLKNKVYTAVLEEIVEGRYKPNEILTEGTLLEKYGVSKSPVREALIELCKDNILQSLPRLGYQIIPVTLKEIVDLLDFRVDLELSNLRKAAERVRPEDLMALRRVASDVGPGCSDRIAHNWALNEQFHLQLCGLSDNQYTYKMLATTLRQSSRFASQYYKSAWAKDSESQSRYHIAILDALGEGNLARAGEMLRQDILAVKQEIQRVLL